MRDNQGGPPQGDPAHLQDLRRISEEHFRSLVEMSSDAIFLVDGQAQIQYASPSLERVMGYSIDELTGRSGFELVHPDDLARSHAIMQSAVDRPGEHVPFLIRAKHKDGSWRHVEGVLSNHLSNPAVRAVVVNYRDVTESRNAAEALRDNEALKTAMLDAALDGIICIDHESRILEFNHAAERLFGRTRESVLGQNLDCLVPQELRAPHHEGMARYLSTGVAAVLGKRREMPALRADGTQFPVELVITRIPADGPPRFVGFVRDLTERRGAEQERERLQAQMQHAQKTESLGVLAGGIAHDFNNLLTGILGYADLALMELPDNSPGVRLVREIERAALRAADLTQQMLAYSGRGKFVVEPLRVDSLVQEMATLLKTVVSKDAKINLELSPATVTADATQIRQVVMNLITNASDALEGRAGRISVCTGVRDADSAYLANRYLRDELPAGAYAYVEISDDGAGMSEETAARIFDPFFTTKFTGRGLGLAAVLGIVRGHKGAIKVSSTVGRGTVVEVLLPHSGEPSTAQPESQTDASRQQTHGTVLVVDDERTVGTFVKHVLERAGFAVRLAEDGREGLDTFVEHQAEIVAVILDVTMPRLDGLGALTELRKLAPSLPVLMMSGYASQEIMERFEGKGASGFLHKPFQPQQLVERLRQLIPPV